MKSNSWKFESGIQPAHLMAGLREADKELLATCLALFDDSTFTARLGQLYERGSDQLGKWSGGHLAPTYESRRDEKLDNRLVELPARRNMTLWMMMLCALAACSTLSEDAPVTSIETILNKPTAFGGQFVNIEGCYTRYDLGGVYIHVCNEENWINDESRYINAIVSDHSLWAIKENALLTISGRFETFSDTHVGIGWLTSSIGVIEVVSENDRR